MYKFETTVRCGEEADRVSRAFYAFVESEAREDTLVAMHIEPLGKFERRCVTLDSPEALHKFERALELASEAGHQGRWRSAAAGLLGGLAAVAAGWHLGAGV